MPRPDRLLNRRNDSVHHLTRYLGQLLFKRFVFAPFVVCRGKANRETSALDGSPCPTLGCKPGGPLIRRLTYLPQRIHTA
jgi:hypothetical protein